MIRENQIIKLFLEIFAVMVGSVFLYNLFTASESIYRLIIVIDTIVILILIIAGVVYSITMGRA